MACLREHLQNLRLPGSWFCDLMNISSHPLCSKTYTYITACLQCIYNINYAWSVSRGSVKSATAAKDAYICGFCLGINPSQSGSKTSWVQSSGRDLGSCWWVLGNTNISPRREAGTTALLGGSTSTVPAGIQLVLSKECYLCLVATAPRFLCVPVLLLHPFLTLVTSTILHILTGPGGLCLLNRSLKRCLTKSWVGMWSSPELLQGVILQCVNANAFFSTKCHFLLFPFCSVDLLILLDNLVTVSLSHHDVCSYFSLFLLQGTFIRKHELYYLGVILYILNLRYITG